MHTLLEVLVEMRVSDEVAAREAEQEVRSACDALEQSIEHVLATPTPDTAESLQRATHRAYALAFPHANRAGAGCSNDTITALPALLERAQEAIAKVPATARIDRYRKDIERRCDVIRLALAGKHDEIRASLRDAIEDARHDPLCAGYVEQ